MERKVGAETRKLNRGHIYLRPSGSHELSLVDDLETDAITRMKAEGFEPVVVVETSPRNFQAWLKHRQVLDEATSYGLRF